MNPTHPLLEKLHDIDGLDEISRFPLAPGWWGLLALAILLFVGIIIFVVAKVAYHRSWKKDTHNKLTRLENHLTPATSQETLVTLSEYLRRIALRRYSRKECAGLTGKAWLAWLAKHDPQKFDWETKGLSLIQAPYAPNTSLKEGFSPSAIKDLIQAARNWVR